MQLIERTQHGGELCHAVLATARIHEIVAHDAAGVRQQMTECDPRGGAFILYLEVGQHISHGRVERESSFLDKLERNRRRIELGDGADLEKRVGCDGHLRFDIADACCRLREAPARPNAKGSPRYAILAGAFLEHLFQAGSEMSHGHEHPLIRIWLIITALAPPGDKRKLPCRFRSLAAPPVCF